ncbi:uncharacterized protein [Heptranchias perlo]|uniref:uncharacterized protein n=1 Tax=Heptranchias perlo TaxID=212740 RepID=UPI003559B142
MAPHSLSFSSIFCFYYTLHRVTVLLAAASSGLDGVLSQRRNIISFNELRECLKFDVLCNGSDYQVRHYNESAWVGIHLSDHKRSSWKWGVKQLLLYTQGVNEEDVKFDTTAQFLTAYNETEVRQANLYLLLPAQYQANPPTPSNPSLFNIRFSSLNMYVRSFNGNPRKCLKQTRALEKSLTRDEITYDDSIHYVAFCKRSSSIRMPDLSQDDIFSSGNDDFFGNGPTIGTPKPRNNGRGLWELQSRQKPRAEIWFGAAVNPDCPFP